MASKANWNHPRSLMRPRIPPDLKKARPPLNPPVETDRGRELTTAESTHPQFRARAITHPARFPAGHSAVDEKKELLYPCALAECPGGSWSSPFSKQRIPGIPWHPVAGLRFFRRAAGRSPTPRQILKTRAGRQTAQQESLFPAACARLEDHPVFRLTMSGNTVAPLGFFRFRTPQSPLPPPWRTDSQFEEIGKNVPQKSPRRGFDDKCAKHDIVLRRLSHAPSLLAERPVEGMRSCS